MTNNFLVNKSTRKIERGHEEQKKTRRVSSIETKERELKRKKWSACQRVFGYKETNGKSQTKSAPWILAKEISVEQWWGVQGELSEWRRHIFDTVHLSNYMLLQKQENSRRTGCGLEGKVCLHFLWVEKIKYVYMLKMVS